MNPHLRKKRKKRVFQVLEQSGLMENHGKFQRKQGRQTCNNRKKKNYLVSATNYHSTNFSTENCLAIKIKKTQIFINKTAYLGLTILELSKIVMHVFWQDQVKPEYVEKKKNVISTLKVLFFTQKWVKSIITLPRIFWKQDLILQTMNYTYYYLKEKKQKRLLT